MRFREDVANHAGPSNCWIIIDEFVYDVTQFAHEHPGGKAVILRQAGGDATDTFDAVHSRELLEKYKAQL